MRALPPLLTRNCLRDTAFILMPLFWSRSAAIYLVDHSGSTSRRLLKLLPEGLVLDFVFDYGIVEVSDSVIRQICSQPIGRRPLV